jgi:hypothetical protein
VPRETGDGCSWPTVVETAQYGASVSEGEEFLACDNPGFFFEQLGIGNQESD